MSKPKQRGTPLTSDEIFSTALRIVDAEGLDALSMRRLAAEVGVQAASLYHHVPNKEALIDGMLVRLRAEVRLPDPLPEEWSDIFIAIFDEYRRVLAAHPGLVIYAGRRVDSDPDPDGLQYLLQLGFAEDDAVSLWQSMIAFVAGFSMFSSNAAATSTDNLAPELADRAEQWCDETCARTLRVILDGYAAARRPLPDAPGA